MDVLEYFSKAYRQMNRVLLLLAIAITSLIIDMKELSK